MSLFCLCCEIKQITSTTRVAVNLSVQPAFVFDCGFQMKGVLFVSWRLLFFVCFCFLFFVVAVVFVFFFGVCLAVGGGEGGFVEAQIYKHKLS